MSYLFLVSIGPVQSFIETSRRSRDLWFASWMLSELSKTAAYEIVRQNSPDSLIFPAPSNTDDLAPASALQVGNKILARIRQPPDQLGTDIQQAVLSRLRTLRDDAYKPLKFEPDSRRVANLQVDDLLEFFWAAVPFSDSADYGRQRGLVEALLAARKATRDFGPIMWGSKTPKSSLDGQRESVIPEAQYPTPRDGEEVRQQKIDRLYRNYGAGRAERLSGVDLLKRHGSRGPDARFPSTSHMAALPFLTRLSRMDGIRASADAFIKVLTDLEIEFDRVPQRWSDPVLGDHDGSLLFEGRLAESLDGRRLAEAKKALSCFLKVCAAEPKPYYVLLDADGDGMGEIIDNQKTMASHRLLSQTLATFSGAAGAVVEAHDGALIYAGGDDVMAILPLHTALACAGALARTFRVTMHGFKAARDSQSNGEGRPATLSAGLVVSHHIEPLEDALNLAREAKAAAKRHPGKNALAVTVSKRSGVDRSVVGTWGDLDRRLAQFVELHRRDAISDSAAFELADLARRLGGIGSVRVTLAQAMPGEAMRILGRKRPAHGEERSIAEDVLDDIRQMILPAESGAPAVDVAQLAQELIVARLFADAADLAQEPLTDERKEHDHVDH